MQVVSVIPITRGIGTQTLTYFTSKKVEVGSIVEVPLRKKQIPALVVETENAREHKATLKNVDYATKKVGKVVSPKLFVEPLLNAVSDVADYHATSIGSVLAALVPNILLTDPTPYSATDPQHGYSYEQLILQDTFEERIRSHKQSIRESFARKSSVIVVVPTIKDAERLHQELSVGIEERSLLVHGKLTSKQLKKQWGSAVKAEQPVLIIGTSISCAVPRSDVGLVIVEYESSPHHKAQRRPFIDTRIVANQYARYSGARLIYADQLLRIETMWKYHEGSYSEVARPKSRYPGVHKVHIINTHAKGEVIVLSHELDKLITNAVSSGENTFIYSARKGMFPLTICSDCGTLVKCSKCEAPLVIQQKRGSKERIFMCHHCGHNHKTEIYCENCNSWKLKPLGIGIQLVKQKLTGEFPDTPIFHVDSATTNTHKKVESVIQKWKESHGAILIGTELALPFIDHVPNIAISSLDALFAIPDFTIHEKIFRLLLTLREMATKTVLIQTRMPEHEIIQQAQSGDVSSFYRSEIDDRKELEYPPFSIFIKVSTQGTTPTVEKTLNEALSKLEKYKTNLLPATPTRKGSSVSASILVTIPSSEWLDSSLLEILRSFGPKYAIDVAPKSTF